MLIEIHMLKNYPPTNLNRDDTGSPKTCYFGGVQRGRISSQCLKRSWRKSPVLQELIHSELGVRTRKLPELVAEELRKRGIDEELIKAASRKLSGFGNKEGKENKDGDYTAQIVFYSPEDIAAVAAMAAEEITKAPSVKELEKQNAKEWQDRLSKVAVRPITLDIALFGRMVTSDAFADVEASMQVAHAISTNRVSMESDFFTAVDDLISGDSNADLGAGMMGDVDFNSCCYYIYAAIDVDQLNENLKNSPDVAAIVNEAIPSLVQAMAYSNPSGKQNTFAGNVLPEAVLVECKDKKIASSYANAFVKPAVASGNDLVANSIEKLTNEVSIFVKDFALSVRERLWFCKSSYSYKMDGVDRTLCESFPDLIERIRQVLQAK